LAPGKGSQPIARNELVLMKNKNVIKDVKTCKGRQMTRHTKDKNFLKKLTICYFLLLSLSRKFEKEKKMSLIENTRSSGTVNIYK